MRFAVSTALAGLFLALVCARPQTEIISDVEEHPDPFETDPNYFDGSRPIFRFSFFNFEDFFRRITDELKDIADSVPNLGPGANSTTTHQVINGRNVTVNETVYKNDDTYVRVVQVVEIEPEVREQEMVEPAPSKPTEDNEIEDFSTQGINPEAEQLEPHEFRLPEPKFDNSIYVNDARPINMERDTYVNKIIEEKTRGGLYMVPSNVEVFDVKNGKPIQSYSPYNQKTFTEKTQSITI